MTDREILLKKIGTLKFALTDIGIFLDTHPGDAAMIKKRDEYRRELMPLVERYEQQYGPLTKPQNTTNTWTWVKDPWPWDMEG